MESFWSDALAYGVGLAGMLLLFAAVHVASFRLRRFEAVTRAALVQGAVAVALGWGLAFVLAPAHARAQAGQLLAASVTALLSVFTYAMLGPIMAERSLSVFALIILKRRGGPVPEAEMTRILLDPAICAQRYREHAEAGAVRRSDGVLHLTRKGRLLALAYERMLSMLRLRLNFDLDR
jgi:hypothetical protein